jgi:hypothetical protein
VEKAGSMAPGLVDATGRQIDVSPPAGETGNFAFAGGRTASATRRRAAVSPGRPDHSFLLCAVAGAARREKIVNLGTLREQVQHGDQPTADAIVNTDDYGAVVATVEEGNEDDELVAFAAAVLYLRGTVNGLPEACERAVRQAAVASEAEKLLGQEMTWVSSWAIHEPSAKKLRSEADALRALAAQPSEVGQPPKDDFVRFLRGTQDFVLTPQTKLNCWEAVLIAAIRSGKVTDVSPLLATYQNEDDFERLLRDVFVPGRRHAYARENPLGRPVRGDVVLFNDVEHVALATGRKASADNSAVVSFWPPPMWNDPDFESGVVIPVQITTIEEIDEWWRRHQPHKTQFMLAFGSPRWETHPLE